MQCNFIYFGLFISVVYSFHRSCLYININENTGEKNMNVLILKGEVVLILKSSLFQPVNPAWLKLNNIVASRWRKEAWRTHLWLQTKWKPSQCEVWFKSSQELKVDTHCDPAAEPPHSSLQFHSQTSQTMSGGNILLWKLPKRDMTRPACCNQLPAITNKHTITPAPYLDTLLSFYSPDTWSDVK